MRLFGYIENVQDRLDRAAVLTPPFDLAFLEVSSDTVATVRAGQGVSEVRVTAGQASADAT